MTVENIISVVCAYDKIRIESERELVFVGFNSDFRATVENASSYLGREVKRVRVVNSMLLIEIV